MLKKRLIFTLLVDGEDFVLSRNFTLQKVGNIEWLLKNFNFLKISSFIDELIILNVRNKKKNFKKFCSIIQEVTREIFIPIAAGGGIENVDDVKNILRNGADKIVINTLLIENHKELQKISKVIGRQSIIGSIDTKLINGKFLVYNNSTKTYDNSLTNVLNSIPEDTIGELYINSIDRDGTGNGYMLEIINKFQSKIKIPTIMAGGAGNWNHLLEGLKYKKINAVATANLLNFIGDGFQTAREHLVKQFDLPKW